MTRELQELLNRAVEALNEAQNHAVQLCTTRYQIMATRVTGRDFEVDNLYIHDTVLGWSQFEVERRVINKANF